MGKPRHLKRNHYQKKFYRNRNYNGSHNGNFANIDTSEINDFKNLRFLISENALSDETDDKNAWFIDLGVSV